MELCSICLIDRHLGQQAPFNFKCTIHTAVFKNYDSAILLEILRSAREFQEDFNQHDSRKRKRENVQHQLQWPLSPHPDLQGPDGSSAHVDSAPSSPRAMEDLPTHHSTPKSSSSQLGSSTIGDKH